MRILLAGGGLANSLLASRLLEPGSAVEVEVFEAGDALGGNHTWSFHGSDVPADRFRNIAPFIAYTWEHSDVWFPGRRRRLPGRYHSVTSASLHAGLAPRLGPRLHLNTPLREVAPDGVTLADGRRIPGDVVIDGRGPMQMPGMELCWQKFLGQELELDGPHGLTGPLLMDATVEQVDGYRFVYLLPFGPERLLAEDTYYSESPALDLPLLRQRIEAYVAARGWRVRSVEREETGVLPIVLDGDPDTFWPRDDLLARSGLRAGLFHHTTGYSLPHALALAAGMVEVLRQPGIRPAAVGEFPRMAFKDSWRRQAFFRRLNRLLFRAAGPGERWRILQHFYRLPSATVDRFYAGYPTRLDRLRILSGRPPVPIGRALRVLLGDGP